MWFGSASARDDRAPSRDDASAEDAPGGDGAEMDVARGDASSSDAPRTGADAGDAPLDTPGIFLPGTQPNELTAPIRSASICADCHGFYGPYDADSTWKGTMMANAARDPLFHAALTVARQDEPRSGDFCIRCHSPRAWLFGRSEPALISRLEKDDFESVQCDFCHRLTTGPSGTPYIGNGQYFVANDFTRRGPIRDPKAPHDFEYSAYHEESRLCGLCHDVSNPLRGGFPIERTYTEWLSSAFASEGQSCQSCHMPHSRGFACGAADMPERDVHAHEFAGGNYWMPRVLAQEHPELKQGDAYEKTAQNAEAKLRTAADVTLQLPERVTAGQSVAFRVRVENKTGHKLPTGYPEGRRMWLEVEVTDELGTSLLHSGAYDLATATRSDDPQLRTYEVRMAANGVEGFHFILQDEVLQDNRIPPRGFVPRPDTKPVGRDYPTVSFPTTSSARDDQASSVRKRRPGEAQSGKAAAQSEASTSRGVRASFTIDGVPEARTNQSDITLAHWDDAPYELVMPKGVSGMVVVRATLWYQTTSREYVESLRSANGTDDYGQKMLELWQRYDRARPFGMATATGAIEVEPAPPEPELVAEPSPEGGADDDAGVSVEPSPEGGAGADASPPGDEVVGGGCSCSLAVSRRQSYEACFAFAVGIIGLLRHTRARRSRTTSVIR